MTQEDKELLFKDISARLLYGLVINIGDKDLKLDRQHQGIGILYPEDCSDEFNKRNNNASFYITISGCYYGEEIKPYLRPMSSMTEEEEKEWQNLIEEPLIEAITTPQTKLSDRILRAKSEFQAIDYLISHHFDYRGLIPKGLALEALDGMYK